MDHTNKEIRYLGWKQPYAELMLHGKIETRTWDTKYRGLVLITASKSSYCYEAINSISGNEQYKRVLQKVEVGNQLYGYAIAVGRLIESRLMTKEDEYKCFVEYSEPWIEERKSKKTGIVKQVEMKLYCHVYEDVTPIIPFEIKGAQGWRKLDQETINKIRYLKV